MRSSRPLNPTERIMAESSRIGGSVPRIELRAGFRRVAAEIHTAARSARLRPASDRVPNSAVHPPEVVGDAHPPAAVLDVEALGAVGARKRTVGPSVEDEGLAAPWPGRAVVVVADDAEVERLELGRLQYQPERVLDAHTPQKRVPHAVRPSREERTRSKAERDPQDRRSDRDRNPAGKSHRSSFLLL